MPISNYISLLLFTSQTDKQNTKLTFLTIRIYFTQSLLIVLCVLMCSLYCRSSLSFTALAESPRRRSPVGQPWPQHHQGLSAPSATTGLLPHPPSEEEEEKEQFQLHTKCLTPRCQENILECLNQACSDKYVNFNQYSKDAECISPIKISISLHTYHLNPNNKSLSEYISPSICTLYLKRFYKEFYSRINEHVVYVIYVVVYVRSGASDHCSGSAPRLVWVIHNQWNSCIILWYLRPLAAEVGCHGSDPSRTSTDGVFLWLKFKHGHEPCGY